MGNTKTVSKLLGTGCENGFEELVDTKRKHNFVPFHHYGFPCNDQKCL